MGGIAPPGMAPPRDCPFMSLERAACAMALLLSDSCDCTCHDLHDVCMYRRSVVDIASSTLL